MVYMVSDSEQLISDLDAYSYAKDRIDQIKSEINGTSSSEQLSPAKPMTGGCNGWTEADYAEMLFEMCAPGMHNGRPYLQNQASMYVPIKKKTVGPILLGALSFEQQRGFRAGECAGIAQRLSYMTENAGSQLVISPDLIMLRSGIWNLSDKKYCKPEPGKYIPFRVDADIVDESQIRCDSFLRFLNTASGNDRDIIRQLAFFCAYLTLVPKAGAKKIHFLGTAPNSGKSMLIRILRKLIDHTVTMSPNDLGTKFALSSLVDSAVCFSAELPNERLRAKAVGVCKAISGGDGLSAEAKFKNIKFVDLNTKLVWAGNHPLLLEDADSPFLDRLEVIPFQHTIPQDKVDQELEGRIWKERDSWITLLLPAAEQLINSYTFPTSSASRAMKRELYTLNIQQTPQEGVREFVQRYCQKMGGACVPTEVVRKAYRKWCVAEGKPAMPDNRFPMAVVALIDGVVSRPQQFQGHQCMRYDGMAFRDPATGSLIIH